MLIAAITIEFGKGGAFGSEASRAGFILFAAFLLSFAFIRMSTRLMRSPKVPWWPGSIQTGGVHVHHLVFGIVLMLAAGFVAIAIQPGSPGMEITAGAFGIGAGLTLDEYALWLHLEDVYWSDEGRQSIDAVLIAALLGGLVLVGAVPFADQGGSVAEIVVAGLFVIGLAVLASLKGKYVLGIVGLFMLPFSVVGAIRLAKPGSPWARWFYKDGTGKLERARERAAQQTARRTRWLDRIGGAPDKPSPPKLGH